jgi:hypothetical protein
MRVELQKNTHFVSDTLMWATAQLSNDTVTRTVDNRGHSADDLVLLLIKLPVEENSILLCGSIRVFENIVLEVIWIRICVLTTGASSFGNE